MSKEVLGTRPGANSELWCSLLVPFSIFCSNYHSDDHGFRAALCIVGTSLIVTLFCKTIHSAKRQLPRGYLHVYYSTYAVSILLLRYLTDYSFYIILPTIFVAFLGFEWLFKILLKTCCFSLGEAAIIAESCDLFIIACVLSFKEVLSVSPNSTSEVIYFTRFSQVLILGCLVLMYLLYQYPHLRSPLMFYSTCFLAACGILMFEAVYLKQNPISWLFHICTTSKIRVILIMSWIVLVVAAVLFVAYHMKKPQNTASTVIRKYFHVIIISVYVPGLVMDPTFLYLASSVTLAVFVALETCRVLLVPPFGTVLANAFTKFIDDKDSGILILSNIYLLIGCSCPLWLYPPQNGLHISHWSGIISVGIGDMVASATGTTFGKHKWQGSNKTIEGTVCAAITQIIALSSILCIGEIPTAWNLGIILFASIATSIVEAKTTQVDNLVLPLFMFPILSCVKL